MIHASQLFPFFVFIPSFCHPFRDDKVAAAAAGALRNMLIGADTFEEDVFGPLLGPASQAPEW